MALTNAFYEAVQSGNVRRVRIMMQDSLLIVPTFAEFNAMEKAASSMKGLYDKHDGKEFIEDRTLWNDEYMDKVMVKVLSNFSHERINHLKEVVRYLRPVTTATQPVTPKGKQAHYNRNYDSAHTNSYEEEKRQCQERGDYLGAKIGTGAVVGAIVGGVIASAASASIVSGVVAGAVVGGVATTIIVKNRGKK